LSSQKSVDDDWGEFYTLVSDPHFVIFIAEWVVTVFRDIDNELLH
jgi:hypothetical protein